ncbi:MAG TPA: EAL domain-containing protein [Solirubrobacteraceae bacterium]|jgi:EAL domain-containing protein (putative c-di-GMP-specific phosphodiesterase class I)
MTSATCAVTPHFVFEPLNVAPARRYDAGGLTQICSVAGLERRPWLSRLRRAIREERFTLHYQPIVSLQSGEITHHEALVRLADEPDGSLVAPARFLPAAERYSLVGEIDRLVVSQALARIGKMRPRPLLAPRALPCSGADELRVAVNLSALSVTDPGMLAHIEGELVRHRVDADRLIVEVTETAAISDMACARDFCAGVRALGARVALDDFGAGFGSFHYLKHLPFDYLKIDGEFIRKLTSSTADQLVVEALVGVARGMGKQTIAEFVKDQRTVSLLRELGVDYAQGFQIGRPVAEPALAYAA